MAKIDLEKMEPNELETLISQAREKLEEKRKFDVIAVITDMLKTASPEEVDTIKGVLTGEFVATPKTKAKATVSAPTARKRGPNKAKSTPDYSSLSFDATKIEQSLNGNEAVNINHILGILAPTDDENLAKEFVSVTLKKLIQSGKVIKVGKGRGTTYQAI